MRHERVPVLVVGAGYAGLSAATLLAWRDVPVMVVEKHPSTSIQPKAFGVGPRALEMLRTVPGVEQSLTSIWEGIGDGMRIAIARSLDDPDPHMILENNDDLAFLADVSPAPQVGAPQAEVERVLRDKAEELGADLRFSTELISLEQDADGVTAVIRADGEDTTVRADYVVAADGYRSPLRSKLGIPVGGKGELSQMCAIMFDADLSDLVHDREVTLWYLRNDEFSGVIVTGTGVGMHVLGVHYDATKGETEADFTPQRCLDLVRKATGRPDLDVRLIDTTSFAMAHILAERYREGRVFLAGDAAHTMPPTGGQGGSTALQDGCDIAWRLWLVISGQAGPGLLDTYDAERRPIGALTADGQLANLGVRMPPAARIGYPEPLEDPISLMVSYRYHSTAIVEEPGDDGSLLEDCRVPTGRPGSRAPHVLLDWDGQPISTIDLFGSGFVLMADQAGQAWVDAARLVKDRIGVQLMRLRVNGEMKDVQGCFRERYGVSEGGAVLVRPDGCIAWRSPGPTPNPAATLEQAFTQILHR